MKIVKRIIRLDVYVIKEKKVQKEDRDWKLTSK